MLLWVLYLLINKSFMMSFMMNLNGLVMSQLVDVKISQRFSYGQLGGIREHFSNFNTHLNPLGILLKSRFWLYRSGMRFEVFHFYKTLWWYRCCWFMDHILNSTHGRSRALLSFKRLFSSSSLSARGWCHLHTWGYWYFSQQSWFQLMLPLAQRFSWCTLYIR